MAVERQNAAVALYSYTVRHNVRPVQYLNPNCCYGKFIIFETETKGWVFKKFGVHNAVVHELAVAESAVDRLTRADVRHENKMFSIFRVYSLHVAL